MSTYILILKDNFYISLIDLKKKENMKNLNEEIGFLGYLTYTLNELTIQEKIKNNSSRDLMIFFFNWIISLIFEFGFVNLEIFFFYECSC